MSSFSPDHSSYSKQSPTLPPPRKVPRQVYTKRKIHTTRYSAPVASSTSDDNEDKAGPSTGMKYNRKNAGTASVLMRSLSYSSSNSEEEVEEIEESSPTKSVRLSKSDRTSLLASPTRMTSASKRQLNDDQSAARHMRPNSQDTNIEASRLNDVAMNSSSIRQAKQTPSTPPPSSVRTVKPLTPHSSPRDLSALFAAVSPNKQADPTSSPRGKVHESGNGRRRGGPRRMLTKTQSLGPAPKTPSKADSPLHHSPFGRAMPASETSTPSRSIGQTQSLPDGPLSAAEPDPAALLLPLPLAPSASGSGGKAKRTYGSRRTFLAESGSTVEVTTQRDGPAPKESYAELKKRFEIDNTGFGEHSPSAGNLMAVKYSATESLVCLQDQDFLLARAPQPVSDMRSRGENRRFMDEVGYLTEGIADKGSKINTRCAR